MLMRKILGVEYMGTLNVCKSKPILKLKVYSPGQVAQLVTALS